MDNFQLLKVRRTWIHSLMSAKLPTNRLSVMV
jgi:hypothetical protein